MDEPAVAGRITAAVVDLTNEDLQGRFPGGDGAGKSGKQSEPELEESETDMHHFPLFARLPEELRLQFWNEACAAAVGKPRILDFVIKGSDVWTAVPGDLLKYRVQGARRLLGVDSECHVVAFRHWLPDTLQFQTEQGRVGVVHFDKTKDVIAVFWSNIAELSPSLSGQTPADLSALAPRAGWTIPGFSRQIRLLALDEMMLKRSGVMAAMGEEFMEPNSFIWPLLDTFPNVERVFERLSWHWYCNLAWCLSAHGVNMCETAGRSGEPVEFPVVPFWPDPSRREDFVNGTEWHDTVRPVGEMARVYSEQWGASLPQRFVSRMAKVDLYPMPYFGGDNGQLGLQDLRRPWLI